MIKLNVVFHNSQKEYLDSLANDLGIKKSELARASLMVGLDTIAQIASQDIKEARKYSLVNDAKGKECI